MRTHFCGLVDEALLGQSVTLCGWTDVARLTAAGVPAVNYGPGETEQAHQVGESVELAKLDRSYQVMRSFLTEG